MRTQRRCIKHRRGATMVEFALISTLLIGLTMAMIQYGIIFNTTIGLTNLSREGARYAAVHDDNDDPIIDYIKANLPGGIDAADLTIAITPEEGSPQRTKGQPITVTITYPMSRKLFLPSKFLGMPIFSANYTTSGRMMIES